MSSYRVFCALRLILVTWSMPNLNGVFRVTFGGWYQRTTLHLTEVYDLLAYGRSHLDLNRVKLTGFQQAMGIRSVAREVGYLEYVRVTTEHGIEIRYYEDGLYVLEMETNEIPKAKAAMERYYEEKFAPAIAYIFSLGAPTPKVLANLKTVHPVAVSVVMTNPEAYEVDEKEFGTVYSSIKSDEMVVKKTSGYIFMVSTPKQKLMLRDLAEMQIFFREFKDQLEKYLNIHRKVWEEISDIKEQKEIRGAEVERVLGKLDSYQKTINLIGSRINQMGAYVHTRADVAKETKIEEHLALLFQYKFDVLSNTHSYIKEIWSMTANYLDSAIHVVKDIEGRSTNKSIQSLQLITTYGVVGGIIGYLSRDSLPKVTMSGLVYFGLLVVVTWIVNKAVSAAYQRTKFKMEFAERVKNI